MCLGWEGFEIVYPAVGVRVTEYVGILFAFEPFIFPIELDDLVRGVLARDGVGWLAIHL